MKNRITCTAVIAGLLATFSVAGLLATFSVAAPAHDELNFQARLSGAEEVPPVATDVRGRAHLQVKTDDSMMPTRIRFRLRLRTRMVEPGLLGEAGAHIHCGAVGANGPIAAFLAGRAEGGYNGRLEVRAILTDANVLPTNCGASLAELVEAMKAGETYVNVHSVDNPGGEVRGQIFPTNDDNDN
jgi:hypothetical protein